MNNNANGFVGTKLPNLTVLCRPSDWGGAGSRTSASPEQAQPEGARKIEQSIHYMMQHLNRPLQVAELAETAHTSESHYFALFKRWVGLSPIDYFIRLRMKQACWLLTGSSMSVKEVAVTLGYDDPFYFSRVFKSINGAAPSAYRSRREELEQTQNHGADAADRERGAAAAPAVDRTGRGSWRRPGDAGVGQASFHLMKAGSPR